jgi:hypothetical protein
MIVPSASVGKRAGPPAERYHFYPNALADPRDLGPVTIYSTLGVSFDP